MKQDEAGGTTTAGRARSVNTLMKRGGYVPDPVREARLRRVTRARNLLIRDLGGDPSKAQTVLAGNAATFIVWLEDNSERMLQGGTDVAREYVNVSRACKQVLEALGIERKPRDVMTLGKYLQGEE